MKLSLAFAVLTAVASWSVAKAEFNGLRKLAPNCDKDNDGYLKNSGACGGDDCDDNNASVNPGAAEICGNGIDDNCDGQIDEGCSTGGGADGICASGTPNSGQTCTSDTECGGTCSANSNNQGSPCIGNGNCPPNNGNPANRGTCELVAGSCEFAPTTPAPVSSSPTGSPVDPNAVTYHPGDLTVSCDGLTLSTGMSCLKLTTAEQKVQFTDGSGGQSQDSMHRAADGAAVIPHPSDGGWYYVSNSESSSAGGVGSIRFNAQGQVIGYQRNLVGTSRNCGGGRTYWNTWVTCEENGSSGRLYKVDPFSGFTQQIDAVPVGGNYESFAFDNQDPGGARFFTTEDASSGALVRYTPPASAFDTSNDYNILNTTGGTHDYLVLSGSGDSGTFTWSMDEDAGRTSAGDWFPNAEGIDVHNRILYFVSKVNKELFELDLAAQTWTKTSTVSGAFNLQPDQLGRIIGDGDVLYFCEDGGSACDIHGRDSTGQFFTIVTGDDYNTETTGLAFSPDNMFMYVSFQGDSNIFAFWRDDGRPFNGAVVDTKYH